jgi:hypothetical protein
MTPTEGGYARLQLRREEREIQYLCELRLAHPIHARSGEAVVIEGVRLDRKASRWSIDDWDGVA